MGSKQVASGEPVRHELYIGVSRVVRLGLNLKVVERWLQGEAENSGNDNLVGGFEKESAFI